MADTERVRYGLSNMHIAFVSKDSTDTAPKWDTPIRMPGAVSWTPETTQDAINFYADNILYYARQSATGMTAELEMAKFPDAILAEMHGDILTTDGGILTVSNGTHKDFAVMFQTEGDTFARRTVFYMCSGGQPNTEHSTTSDTTDITTETMPITATPCRIGGGAGSGIYAFKWSVTNEGTGQSAYANFFTEVYVPTLPVEGA